MFRAIRHRRPALQLLQSAGRNRSLWGQAKFRKTEQDAYSEQYRADPRKQAEYYKELFNEGRHSQIVSLYETQSQLPSASSRYPEEVRNRDLYAIQKDPDCVKYYVKALVKTGQIDRIIAQLARGPSSLNEGVSRGMAKDEPVAPVDPFSSPDDTREYVIQNDGNRPVPPELKRLVNSRRRVGTTQYQQQQEYSTNEPVHLVIREAFSWAKVARKAGGRLVTGLLIITGLSVLIEQQGIMRPNGMASGEPEPMTASQLVTFDDVQGVDEAKEDLQEVVEYLRNPRKFSQVGGKLPKGVLLYGPPGTGKTHLARAIAGEAGVPFFQMSGSEFDEMYVGVGARRVRELFSAARKRAPCIVFIDELDAVGSKRSPRDQGYMRQTLNQLLVELDGFSSSEGVIFIAATNTPEALDKALTRPGRFDKHIAVPLPDVRGRTKILQIHSKGVRMAPNIDLSIIARGTPGYSGADLANLINQAAIKASKDGSKEVRSLDLEWARDKIAMGAERKSAVIDEKCKKNTAYHEGGHTLVALFTPGATPLHKVTIVPRGMALGVTWTLPEADKISETRRNLMAELDVCMGGKAAEELLGGADEVTSGCSNDLKQATRIARSMVMKFGMSERLGPISLDEEDLKNMGPEVRALVDSEVKSLLENSYKRASALLRAKRTELDRLAGALLEHETLDVEEVRQAISGKKVVKQL